MRLGRLAGTPVAVHQLTLAGIGLAAAAGYGTALALAGAALLVHEAGHLLACRAVGVRPARLVLWPFGAVIELPPGALGSPAAESVVAAAGPLASLAVAALAAAAVAAGAETPASRLFLAANLAVGGVNVLPVLPLDGGRWLRAALAMRWGPIHAAERVRRVGVAVQIAAAGVGAGLAVAGLVAERPLFLAAGVQTLVLAAIGRLAGRTRDPASGGAGGGARAATVLVTPPDGPARSALAWGDPSGLLVWVVDAGGRARGPITGRAIARAVVERGADVAAGDLLPP